MAARGFFLDNAPFLSAGMLLTFLSSFGQTFFLSVFGGVIRADYGLSHGAWGLIYALGTAASAVVMVYAGSASDIWRVRHLALIVLPALGLACLAMAVSNHVAWLLAIVFALRFLGQGMSSHLALVAMVRWFGGMRGRALSIATLGFAIGEAVLPLAAVALMTLTDWRWVWVLAALICLGAMPVVWRLLARERTPRALAETDAKAGLGSRHWTRGEVLRSPLFWALLPGLLGPPAFITAFFFHQAHFAEIKGWRHVELVALFPLYTAAAVVAMLLSGWALDRFGATRLTAWALLPLALGFAITSAASSGGAMLAALLCLALTTGAFATLPNALWAELFGTAHLGAIKALAAGAVVMGTALGPGLTGLLVDAGIGLETQFAAVAVYLLAAAMLMAVVLRRAMRGPRARSLTPARARSGSRSRSRR